MRKTQSQITVQLPISRDFCPHQTGAGSGIVPGHRVFSLTGRTAGKNN
jgi:hypothetical protein